MEIYEVLKIMSSENKAKIIAKFIDCDNCHNDTVGDMCGEVGLKQANLSKHLMELRQKGVLKDTKEGRKVIYTINPSFKKEWGSLIVTIIDENKDLKKAYCGCKK